MKNLQKRLSQAVKHFWARELQTERQGTVSGTKEYGGRSAVTGGAQLDGFAALVHDLLAETGIPHPHVYRKRGSAILPGYFRGTKQWDLVVVSDGVLVASIEFKSHIGSFGNNVNNRMEEAIGSATDLWTAFREGAFKMSQRPWLGYLILLEDHPRSLAPVRSREPHFQVFPEFVDASYARRYELFCERLVRERLYDSACLIMSDRQGGLKGEYTEPNPELSFNNFAASLTGRASAIAQAQ